MPEINLLQNRIKDTTFSSQRQSRSVLTALTVLLILLAVIGGGLLLLSKSLGNKSAELTSQNSALQAQLDQEQTQIAAAKTLQAQLTNVRTLVNGHTYLTPLLEEIGKMTYTKAQYVTLDITSNGSVHLEGKVPDYGSLAKFILGLNTSSNFKNVRLLSVAPSSGTVNSFVFAVDLVASSDLFVKK